MVKIFNRYKENSGTTNKIVRGVITHRRDEVVAVRLFPLISPGSLEKFFLKIGIVYNLYT